MKRARRRNLTVIAGILVAIAIISYMTASTALAQTNATTATIAGQVNVNGVPTNGVSVTCGSGSATTSNYNGVDGVYVITGLPFGTSLPFAASYQGNTYTDTIDPLTSNQQYYEIPVVNIVPQAGTPTPVPTSTVTPTPLANATVTPTPATNATVTPTPAANATVTPTPATNATVPPTPTVTPTATPAPTATPVAATPEPAPAPAAAPAQSSPDISPPETTPLPTPVLSTPIPTGRVKESIAMDPTATAAPYGIGTTTPLPIQPGSGTGNPTTAQSPGFAGVLALGCLLGVAYLAGKKRQ